MTLIVWRDRSMADAIGPRVAADEGDVDAASIATSAPAPIAMPRSAAARAGASLIPSPTIATRRPARLELGRRWLPCRSGARPR